MSLVLDSGEVLISADSHVMEPHDLWSKALSAHFGDKAPAFKPLPVGEGLQFHAGGHDPHERIKEMAEDGVRAEVLYPSLGLGLFGLQEAALQQAVFHVYNDWLIEYCQVSPDRLVGVAAISMYEIGPAIEELRRCRAAGLRGAMIWGVPPADLPFSSDHYEPFWAAAAELDMPVSLHILTGHDSTKRQFQMGDIDHYRISVNDKLTNVTNALFEILFYGVLHRHPNLRIVIVEHEIGWMPFLIQQWDWYREKYGKVNPPLIDRLPGEYVREQVYATFFDDPAGARMLSWWGQNTCMWSNYYPHKNSTWPHSREVIERDLGGLDAAVRAKLVRENVVRLYNMRVPALV
jgi:uncharacterized protein